MLETCGTLYKALWEKFSTSDLLEEAPDIAYGTYAAGFMAGQAEKVYSGACTAFMIRPGSDWWAWACETMRLICGHYGLDVYEDVTHGEVWGCDNEHTRIKINTLATETRENSQLWHMMRALWCGIPRDRVDTAYHERQHWRERCEPGGC